MHPPMRARNVRPEPPTTSTAISPSCRADSVVDRARSWGVSPGARSCGSSHERPWMLSDVAGVHCRSERIDDSQPAVLEGGTCCKALSCLTGFKGYRGRQFGGSRATCGFESVRGYTCRRGGVAARGWLNLQRHHDNCRILGHALTRRLEDHRLFAKGMDVHRLPMSARRTH